MTNQDLLFYNRVHRFLRLFDRYIIAFGVAALLLLTAHEASAFIVSCDFWCQWDPFAFLYCSC